MRFYLSFIFFFALLSFGCSGGEPAPSEPASSATPANASGETHPEVRFELELGDNLPADRLLRGLHDSEGPWRWTERVFAFALDPPEADPPIYVELEFALAEALMKDFGEVTLTARANEVDVGSETYAEHGTHLFTKPVPPEALNSKRVEVEFALDKAKRPDGPGDRELGLIAISVALKGLETTKSFGIEQLSLAQRRYREIINQRNIKLPPQQHNQLMRLFHDLDVWDGMWFLGHKIIKNPLDLWMMQQIMYEVRPDFVIETGTYQGGSALYWAHVLDGLGLENSKVLTIDIQDAKQEASRHPLWQRYVQFFHGSSTDPAIVARIAEMVRGKKVLVTLDSMHTMTHVRDELRLYSPLVSSGSYIVVEDTHYDAVPTHPERGPGPMAAVNLFLEEGGRELFEQDDTREAMLMTFNPGGWLRRKTP